MFTIQDASGSNGRVSPLTEPQPPEPIRPAAGDEPALAHDEGEETLIVDHRANLGPAQLVEHKLSSMLGGAALPVSHVRMLTQLGNRNHC